MKLRLVFKKNGLMRSTFKNDTVLVHNVTKIESTKYRTVTNKKVEWLELYTFDSDLQHEKLFLSCTVDSIETMTIL